MSELAARSLPWCLMGARRLACTLGCLAAAAALCGKLPASELRRSAIVLAYEGARHSVVNIHGQKTLEADATTRPDAQRRVNGMGTGVVLDPRGYIVTNFHVVDGVRKIEVTLSTGETLIARMVSSDPTTDLALIKVDAPRPLPVITLGTSRDLMIGESVIAVGNAYGYENTVTRGIISALHRSVQVSDVQHYDDLIQTDASINPGNSGGPLLNIDGEMIGINVAVRAGAQGIGFAIPVDKVLGICARLMSVERLENYWHGVVADETTATPGAVVRKVADSSPAAQTGLRPGDVITAVGAQQVIRSLDLERALLGRKAGEAVELTVHRNQKPVKLNLTLAEIPRRDPSDPETLWEVLGLRLAPIASQQFRQYQSRYRGGLAVTAVRPDGPAARQGIRRGDVLVGMHVWETISLDNVAYILNRPDLHEIEPLKFYILRGNETLYGHMTVSARTRQ